MTVDLSALEAELKRDPGSRRFAELAKEYQRLGRLDEARGLCEQGLSKHPNLWQARLLLSQIYLGQGRVDDARGSVEKILLALPDHVGANHLAADIYFALGDRARALKHYQVVALFEPGRPGVAEKIASLSAEPPLPAAPPPAEAAAPEAATAPLPAPEPMEPRAAEPPPAVVPSPAPPSAASSVIAHAEQVFAEEPVATLKMEAWPPEAPAAEPETGGHAAHAAGGASGASFKELTGLDESDLGGGLLDAGETVQEAAAAAPPDDEETQPEAPVLAGGLPAAAVPPSAAAGEALNTTTLAELYARQGFPEKAVEIYQRVLLDDPERHDIQRKIQDLMHRISGEAPEFPEVRAEDVRRAVRHRRVQVLEGWLRRVREERHV